MALVHKVLLLLFTIWLAATIVFFLLRIMPGDTITTQLMQSGATDAEIAAQRSAFGLDQPLLHQYITYLAGLMRGNLGYSLTSRETVSSMILRSLGPTLVLATGALFVASVVGIALGVASALTIPFGISRLARGILGLSLSVPLYWTGTVGLYIFTVQLGLLPSAGAGRLSQLILPVSVLGFHTSGAIGRVTQANVRETLDTMYVRTAKVKGLTERRILIHHILRVSLLPVMSVIALQVGFLLSGTVITESLFVRPGIGRLLLQATLAQDYPVVQGVVIFTAIAYSMTTMIMDWFSRWLDPRLDI